MKIGILTYYFVHNHGAILQAYGMKKVLEDMGHEVYFLRFDRNYDHMDEGAQNKYNISIRSIPFLIKYFLSNGVGTFYYNLIKREKLQSFRKQYIKLGERYSDAKCDIVLIGSDEVFAIDVGVNPFLYSHDIPVKKIFSYAASFGSTQISDIINFGCYELIESGLKRLMSIGVRDKTSGEMVKTITGLTPELNCDPVFLYGYQKEIEFFRKRNILEKYVILYSYDRNFNNEEEIKIIKEFANKYKLKIWSVGYYHKWCDKNIMCSPIEMFKFFCGAKMVITDTFHGSVISILTNTPLMVRLDKRNQKVEFLLEQYQLQDRLVKNVQDIEKLYNEKIDCNNLNKLIQFQRNKSLKYIKKCLMGNYHD